MANKITSAKFVDFLLTWRVQNNPVLKFICQHLPTKLAYSIFGGTAIYEDSEGNNFIFGGGGRRIYF